MPRVANQPRVNTRIVSNDLAIVSPLKAPSKIPLNDDVQEKAVRMQSRQALHDFQLNQIKAAVTPMRKLNSFHRAASTSPKTPREIANRNTRITDEGELAVVGSNIISPVKRVPILANFEEWMKMATDNKINATNSWNFALIDYFHDMSLLKEGDGVNFQKASCTLDGCVKIYTSRVDSVATETGKLLSGLTENSYKKRSGGDLDGTDDQEQGQEGDDEDGEVDEDGVRKRTKKRAQRSTGATLAPSFAQLQLKKFDLEFSVDPLFKKVAADFDEGGARGLLLNNLSIDSQGRIIFDSSDDTEHTTSEMTVAEPGSTLEGEEGEEGEGKEGEEEGKGRRGETETTHSGPVINMAALQMKFFPDLDLLDQRHICPSLKDFNLGGTTGDLDFPFLKARSDEKQAESKPANLTEHSGILLDDGAAAGFDDDDDDDDDNDGLGGFDLPADLGFGEGGEAWAKDAVIELVIDKPPTGVGANAHLDGGDCGGGLDAGGYSGQDDNYIVALNRGVGKEGNRDDILSYFDDALQKNWAGPEHWRIKKIKDLNKAGTAAAPKTRKEKERFEIDFLSPVDAPLAASIYTAASSTSAISLPKTVWKSKTRNLLPDDKHFNSKQLTQLFLKPKARLRTRPKAAGGSHTLPSGQVRSNVLGPDGEIDEAYWAQEGARLTGQGEDDIKGSYDADFFQDDGLAFPGGLPADDDDDDDFVDAREDFAGLDRNTHPDGAKLPVGSGQEGDYGNQLVTQGGRMRPEYVQYARVAKKVDVRRLKDEMWRGIGLKIESGPGSRRASQAGSTAPVAKADDGPLKFTSVMHDLQGVYPEQMMADISTSYCFICLLHLANEKGLEIANEEGLTDLNIRKDVHAEAPDDEG